MLRNIISPIQLWRGTAAVRNNSSIIATKSRSIFSSIQTKSRSDRVAIPTATKQPWSFTRAKKPIIFGTQAVLNTYQRRYLAIDPANATANNATETPVEVAQIQKAPTPAKVLTYAGVLPFLAGAIGPFFLPIDLASQAVFYQMTYGASILSFVGAVHWGLAMTNYPKQLTDGTTAQGWGQYLFAVTPSLLAWGGLTLAPFNGMIGLLLGFTLAFIGDVVAHNKGLVPAWYLTLRARITVLVLVSLGITFQFLA